ncbi:hypothetical protein ACFOD4_02440 [Pseudoroseomonas globiformis]|uniref:Uncharacterized protein n=1 Tax=Teichococcus globiformis TaxID=2307229 RepID=A0ABV7FX97_9PROT
MRHVFTLCLLGLLAGGLVPKAEAAGRGDTKVSAGKTGKALSTVGSASARQAAKPRQASAASASGGQVRQAAAKPPQILRPGASAGGKSQRVVARTPRARAAAPQRTSWQAGLPAASGEQRECPVGTLSTLARGHDNVVRCLPL